MVLKSHWIWLSIYSKGATKIIIGRIISVRMVNIFILKPIMQFHQCGWFKEHLPFCVLDDFDQVLAFDFSECGYFYFTM